MVELDRGATVGGYVAALQSQEIFRKPLVFAK